MYILNIEPNVSTTRAPDDVYTTQYIDWDYYSGEKEWAAFIHTTANRRFTESRPCGRDNFGVEIYPISSIRQLPRWFFDHPTYSALLPPFSKEIAYATGFPAKPILLKKNVVEKNRKEHDEVGDNIGVLSQALYHATTVVFDRPQEKSFYRVVVCRGRHYALATIDLDRKKRYIEVVDWRSIRQEGYNELLRRMVKNNGFIQDVIGAWG